VNHLLKAAVDAAVLRADRRGIVVTVWAWPTGGAYMVTSSAAEWDEAVDTGWLFCAEHSRER
jgi:hypothetical protein